MAGEEGQRATFKIKVEAKGANHFPESVGVLLTLIDGEKRVADVPIAMEKTANGITTQTFYVSPEYLTKSILEFDVFSVSNGVAIPGGTSFWFYLKDFAKEK